MRQRCARTASSALRSPVTAAFARLTQVTLHDLRLSACDESLPRIAFIAIPEDTVLVSLLIGNGPWTLWGGMEMQANEIITLGPGGSDLWLQNNAA